MIHEFKMTEGTARQEFRNGECVGQEFIAGDEVNWEDEAGIHIGDPTHLDVYQPFDMVQPDEAVEQRLAGLKAKLAAVPQFVYIVMQDDYSWKVVDRETYLHPPDSMINNKASVSSEGMTEILVSNLLPPDLLSLQELIALEKVKLEKRHE